MKNIIILLFICISFFTLRCITYEIDNNLISKKQPPNKYVYPSFYKGVYLHISPKSNFKRFKYHINKAVRYGMNTVVLDSWRVDNLFTEKHFNYMKDKNIHAITRIVMFQDGLKSFKHVTPKLLQSRFELIEKACQVGFKEIQLDYIRFRDSKRKDNAIRKASFIESIVEQAKNICNKYSVKLSVDIFGRIPFTKNDRIGQRMEKLDKIVDVICPMAYPSYYSRQMRRSTSNLIKSVVRKSKQRVKKAKIVLWIQGFRHRNIRSKSYYRFIYNQIKASKDCNSDGFIVWNAGRNYRTLYAVMNRHFNNKGLNNKYIAMR